MPAPDGVHIIGGDVRVWTKGISFRKAHFKLRMHFDYGKDLSLEGTLKGPIPGGQLAFTGGYGGLSPFTPEELAGQKAHVAFATWLVGTAVINIKVGGIDFVQIAVAGVGTGLGQIGGFAQFSGVH